MAWTALPLLKESWGNWMGKRLLITCTDSMMKQFLEQHVIHLIENGYTVDVACSEVLDRFSEVSADLKGYAKLYKLSMQRSPFDRSNLKGYREVREIIEQGNYDIIWTNEPVMGMLTRLAARKARKRGTQVIYMAHGFHFYQGAPKKNWMIYYPIEKWMARYTDKLITINKEDYQFAKKHFSCPVFHIHGIGADSKRFHPISQEEQQKRRKELGFGGPVILNVGELNANKNQKTAILAFKEVVKQYPSAKLLIAGKGEEKENLERLARAEGIKENVVFLGYTLELEKYMQICDAVIACSYREGLPLNVIEAMLCGKPMVASHNRGHNELIQDGVNGYLVNADDTSGYAAKICDILAAKKDFSDASLQCAEPYTDRQVRSELTAILFEKEPK